MQQQFSMQTRNLSHSLINYETIRVNLMVDIKKKNLWPRLFTDENYKLPGRAFRLTSRSRFRDRCESFTSSGIIHSVQWDFFQSTPPQISMSEKLKQNV